MSLKTKFVFAHMKAASVYSELSYCVRLKVGAVIVKNGSVISFGYNGMPSGEPNVCELEDGTTDPRVRHAEINALRKLIRSSESSVDACLFVTHSPCEFCAIEIFESGIKAVFYTESYRDMTGVEKLIQKGVRVYKVDAKENKIYEHLFYGHPLLVRDEFVSF